MKENILIEKRQHFVYSDSAKLIRPWMGRLFIREFATLSQLAFDTEITSLLVLVEHNYRNLKQIRTSQDYAQTLKR